MPNPYDRLAELGLSLLTPATPIANYVPSTRVGNLLYLSGQGPRDADGRLMIGKVGRDIGIEDAYAHARLTGLNLLSVAHQVLGDLGRIVQTVKLLGMVNAVPDFADHPAVINGCSDLFVDVLGAAGRHARSAVGMGSLPGGISVEIEAIFEISGAAL
ncbi:RidA family protein [Lichenifustis flavocetrariae]|uniref:RidA family protein n=1 Tax=Lichenifustis flavocetrariae TaxID=2949735 RepID=A0AA41YRR0_9HYPH|nr:RidA family protein [Lichenifustis flavocetrariae]MCW6507326.1 RidA family protein [Lichenifustis flavocetrariae]